MEIVQKKKRPSPEIYEWILEKLRLPPQLCVAIEDSLRGAKSAMNADINVLVTPSFIPKMRILMKQKLLFQV